MATQVVTEQTPGLEITLTIQADDIGEVEGSFASDEPELDAQTVADIRRRALAGDEWAWCTVCVEVSYQGIVAKDYLGGCSYDGERDFKADGYYRDMVYECLKQLNATLACIDACELAPHATPILSCACGFVRR